MILGVLGGLEGVWGHLETPSGGLGASKGDFGSSLGGLGATLGSFWSILGRSSGVLGHSWGVLGRSWGVFWVSWDTHGTNFLDFLGHWATFKIIENHWFLLVFWGLGIFWRGLGTILGASWEHFVTFWVTCFVLDASRDNLFSSWGHFGSS